VSRADRRSIKQAAVNEKGGKKMKRILVMMATAVLLITLSTTIAIAGTPEISNLVYEGEKELARGGAILILTFVSNQKPDEIGVQMYGGSNKKGGRSANHFYSSKNKDEITLTVKEIKEAYQVIASVNTGRPLYPGEYDVSLWVTVDGRKSNVLPGPETEKIKVSFGNR
jgi:hypothetical protein